MTILNSDAAGTARTAPVKPKRELIAESAGASDCSGLLRKAQRFYDGASSHLAGPTGSRRRAPHDHLFGRASFTRDVSCGRLEALRLLRVDVPLSTKRQFQFFCFKNTSPASAPPLSQTAPPRGAPTAPRRQQKGGWLELAQGSTVT